MLAASKYGSQDFPGGLVVKIHASTAGGACSIPGLGTKITHVTWEKKIFFELSKKETTVYQLKTLDGKTNKWKTKMGVKFHHLASEWESVVLLGPRLKTLVGRWQEEKKHFLEQINFWTWYL